MNQEGKRVYELETDYENKCGDVFELTIRYARNGDADGMEIIEVCHECMPIDLEEYGISHRAMLELAEEHYFDNHQS